MNVFYLDRNPVIAAQMQCNKHVVKMILESAQMLSTAHRILDGKQIDKRWVHSDPNLDNILYRATHINHPSNVWTRSIYANYQWHADHWKALSDEYTYRYGKIHKSWDKLNHILMYSPFNIPTGRLTTPPMCMPDELKSDNVVESYRKYYKSKQEKFDMAWTKRDTPNWFEGELI